MADAEPFYLRTPYGMDGAGRTAGDTETGHLYSLIEAVLFTAPGERPNRPDFGTGINQLIFGAASDETAKATQFLVQGALQRWLGEWIQVEAVNVSSEEATLTISIQFTNRRTQQRQVQVFTQQVQA